MKRQTLIDLRKTKELTQSQIADKLGVSQSAVAMWETGETRPSLDNIDKLSKILNVSLKKLLDVFLTED